MRTFRKPMLWTSKSLLLGLSVLTACGEDPETFVPTVTDSFSYYDRDLYNQAEALLQADYLFVTDWSASMEDEVEAVVESMDLFSEYLRDEEIDYRVGFVRGTTSSNGGGNLASIYNAIPKSLVAPMITTATTNVALENSIASQIEGFGDPNSANSPFMLESAERVAKNSSLGFVRDAAQLVYIFLSDADDISVDNPFLGSRGVANYVEGLSVKSHASYINARAWVLTGDTDCLADNTSGEKVGTHLMTAATALNTGSSEAVQCLRQSNGMAESLQALARDVTRPTKRFKIRTTPIETTIKISIDGVETSRGPDWYYEAATKEIIFRDGREPAPGSRLDIEYSPLIKLSSRPDSDTIVVTVTGVEVAKSAWTYDTAKNEIRFTGSYRPSEAAEIRVTYQSK